MEQISTSSVPYASDEVLSSEDEQERQEEQKEVFTATVKLESGIPGPVRNIVVVNSGQAQALSKIVFEVGTEKEIGKAEVLCQEKTKDVLKIYYIPANELLVLHPEGVKGAWSESVISQLLSHFKADPKPRIVILDSVYKTNYTHTDGHLSVEEGNYPLFHYRSAHVAGDQQLATFLAKSSKPAGVLNLLGGFTAALLVHAEINGYSAVAINSILDSHYVTAETLGSFGTILKEVLGVPYTGVTRLPKFKEVLKDANQRGHNIFN